MGLEQHLRHAEADLALAYNSVSRARDSAADPFQPLLREVANALASTQILLASIRRIEPLHPELRGAK